MSISSIAALGGVLNFSTTPYTPPAASTRSITQLANGSTVTTVRGATGEVLAVTTAAAAQNPGAQDQTSTFYVTA